MQNKKGKTNFDERVTWTEVYERRKRGAITSSQSEREGIMMKTTRFLIKRSLTVLLTGLLTVASLSVPVFASEKAGFRQVPESEYRNSMISKIFGKHSEGEEEGKESDISFAVEINTVSDLRNIASDLSESYVLMKDLDLKNEDWTPIGTEEEPFTGTFNGNGHLIEGLKIESDENCQGLFGMTHQASISNLAVSGSVQGYTSVGGIVGSASETTIDYCVTVVSVNGVDRVGGVIGLADRCRISYCMNSGPVSGSRRCCGGIVGDLYSDNDMDHCLNLADISGGTDLTGSITGGSTESSVTSCVNTGSVTCQGGRVGAIAGDNASYAGHREDNFFLQTNQINQNFSAIGSGSGTFSSDTDIRVTSLQDTIFEKVACMRQKNGFSLIELLKWVVD